MKRRHDYWWNDKGEARCECGALLGVTLGRHLSPGVVERADNEHAEHMNRTHEGENQ